MEIKRDQELVEAYHYDMPPEDQEVEQVIRLNFTPLESTDPDYPQEDSILQIRLVFVLPVDDRFIVQGSVSQVNHIVGRKVKEQTDLTEEEANELVAPLFKIVERLTYEVTEIALDEPGVNLNFVSTKGQDKPNQ